EVAVKDLELVGQLTVFANSYLGILPMRDDPKLGVEVRYVFPRSPAEKAGLREGDRIVKYGSGKNEVEFKGEVRGCSQLMRWLGTQAPGTEVKLEEKRKDKTKTLTATLDDMPGTQTGQDMSIPERVPQPASFKKALEPLETAAKNVKP